MSWGEVAATGTDPQAVARLVRGRLGGDADVRDELDRIVQAWTTLGVRVALRGDPGYPARLADGAGEAAPRILAWRGPAPAPPERPSVAIVGARRATPYGTGVAAWLAEAAADAGVTVVSGGAVGIDAAAHRGGIAGPTVVVLGCGHDVAYPRPHAAPGALFDQILAAGGTIVSESLPGELARAGRVVARNRIVAGLADVVVVVEGGPRSGALLTAGFAADLGRTVAAVPGDVRAPLSVAPHRLLHEGAAPCTSPEDLLGLLGQLVAEVSSDRTAPSVLPVGVRDVLARRWPRPISVDDLAKAAAVPIGRLLAALTRARIAGEVVEAPEGVRLSRAPA